MAEGCEDNTGLIVAIVLLSLSTVGLVLYIAYDKGYLDVFFATEAEKQADAAMYGRDYKVKNPAYAPAPGAPQPIFTPTAPPPRAAPPRAAPPAYPQQQPAYPNPYPGYRASAATELPSLCYAPA